MEHGGMDNHAGRKAEAAKMYRSRNSLNTESIDILVNEKHLQKSNPTKCNKTLGDQSDYTTRCQSSAFFDKQVHAFAISENPETRSQKNNRFWLLSAEKKHQNPSTMHSPREKPEAEKPSRAERLEVLEAASVLLSLRRHCDEREQWQRARNAFYPTSPMISPFHGQMWPPYYKPHSYDVNALPMMHHHFPFQVPPYMVGPQPWYPVLQSAWLGAARHQEGVASPMSVKECTPKNTSREPVTMETEDTSLKDENDDDDDSGEPEDEIPATTIERSADHKRKRRNLTKHQQEILEKAYSSTSSTKYPQLEERLALSRNTKLSVDRIQVWFQNRRAKEKRLVDVKKSPCQSATPDEEKELIDVMVGDEAMDRDDVESMENDAERNEDYNEN